LLLGSELGNPLGQWLVEGIEDGEVEIARLGAADGSVDGLELGVVLGSTLATRHVQIRVSTSPLIGDALQLYTAPLSFLG